MLMDISWRFGRDLGLTDLFELYESAHRKSGKSLEIWKLAYDERSLEGWNVIPGAVFRASGPVLEAANGSFSEEGFDFQLLTLDTVIGGDFSMQAEVQAAKGEVNFCGLSFGGKNASNFHGLLYFPGKTVAAGGAETGFVDLMSSFGGGSSKTWRHVPVGSDPRRGGDAPRTTSGTPWRDMRLDVSGRNVEIYFDGELLATHEFGSIDVVRGSLGLVCGPGSARFRNIRYLAREASDRAADIHRRVRLEKLRPAEGGAVGGSYQDQIPPFPVVGRWVQGERTSWDEVGPVPQLLVLFSIEQNDLLPIDEWLTDLARQSADYGLKFVAIASPNDDAAIESYLAAHPMPGAIAVDRRETVGIGDSFELYDIRRFNLPRLILIDVNGRVNWEGDPGFEIGSFYDPSMASFLDDPLESLVEKRQLLAVAAWREGWERNGLPALVAGDLETALPLLQQSMDFVRGYYPDVDSAQSRLGAVQSSIRALAITAQSLEREQAEPALEVLMEWAPLFEVEIDRDLRKELKSFLAGRNLKDWTSCTRAVARFAKKKGKELENVAGLLTDLEKLEGRFPRELVQEVQAAAEAGDAGALAELAASAELRPRDWLIREFFGW
jgi:hypothetical protein